MHRTPIASSRLVTPLFCALALAACSSVHEVRQVTSGIYEVEVTGDLDVCSPARETGPMGAVGVSSRGDVVSLGLPAALGAAHVSLSRAAGFHAEVAAPLDGCSGAWVRREITVLDAHAGDFSVAYRERWHGLDTCLGRVVPRMPAADCAADLVARYTLSEVCEAPCVVSLDAGGARCACE